MNVVKLKSPSESDECKTFFAWILLKPQIRTLSFHIPNEGKRSRFTSWLLQLIGLRPGVPDYFIPEPCGKYHGLFIEMKTRDKRGKRMPEKQIEFIAGLMQKGYYATFAYGADDAIKIVTDYLSDKL